MKQKAIKALAAVDRLFDCCEEIEGSEYNMLDDIWLLRDYIKQGHEARWELVYHDDNPDYYAKYVTARCSKCKRWFWGNEHHRPGEKGGKYGVRVSSAFCMNDNYKKVRSLMKFSLLDDAEKALNASNDLPTFCGCCGARMRGVEYTWEDMKDGM